jgi:modulator of FtsH protease
LTAYDPSQWSELFVASAGASAALAGLVFVAVSINIERILQFQGLPERALETVLLLLSVVLVSIIGLIPGQSHTALGAELLGEGLVIGGAIIALSRHSVPPGSRPRYSLLGRRVVIVLGTLPLIVGGASVIAETGGGLYWTVAGMVLAIGGSVANAWVLLVEILR